MTSNGKVSTQYFRDHDSSSPVSPRMLSTLCCLGHLPARHKAEQGFLDFQHDNLPLPRRSQCVTPMTQANTKLAAADLKGPRNAIIWAAAMSKILGPDRIISCAIKKPGWIWSDLTGSDSGAELLIQAIKFWQYSGEDRNWVWSPAVNIPEKFSVPEQSRAGPIRGHVPVN